jgi:hypothetical protein
VKPVETVLRTAVDDWSQLWSLIEIGEGDEPAESICAALLLVAARLDDLVDVLANRVPAEG